MNGLYQSLTVGASYKELGTYAIDSITYNGKNIKSDVNNLSVTTVAIKKSDNTSITPNDITAAKGKYIAEYSVSFTYKNKHITRYIAESWHIRYVGKEAAKIIYENNLSLEEYVDLYIKEY